MPDWIEPIATALAAGIALVAVVVATLAPRDSQRSADAADTAERSAATSEDAPRASAESAAVARREEAGEVERTDAEWRRMVELPERRGHLEFRDVDTTTAQVVAAVVTVDGERVHLQLDEVLAGDSVTVDASKLGKRVAVGGTVGGKYISSTRFDATARITLRSALSAPGVWKYHE